MIRRWRIVSGISEKKTGFLAAVYRLLHRIEATGSSHRKRGRGGRHTASTNDNTCRKRLRSVENEPETNKTVRQIAAKAGIQK